MSSNHVAALAPLKFQWINELPLPCGNLAPVHDRTRWLRAARDKGHILHSPTGHPLQLVEPHELNRSLLSILWVRPALQLSNRARRKEWHSRFVDKLPILGIPRIKDRGFSAEIKDL